MLDFLLAVRLEPEPKGRLSAWGGLLDVADEHGLWSFSLGADDLHRLPGGMLWGSFPDEAAALAALDAALASAGALLGYPVRARTRIACQAGAVGMGRADSAIAQAEALLYPVTL
ncbi:MAG TPA: hypothetical protein VHX64_02180 [Caulobacteraceae bacterium]|nr:hypothetical protein [Caulobacteraceae bacterium]